MPRDAFVYGEGSHPVLRRGLDVVQVGVEPTRPAAVERGLLVVGAGRRLLPELGDPHDLDSRLRANVERVVETGVEFVEHRLVVVENLLPALGTVFVVELRPG